MSLATAGRLNLTGINEELLRQPRSGVNKSFSISTEEVVVGSSVERGSIGGKICMLVIMSVFVVFGIVKVSKVQRDPIVIKKFETGLRRIIRMPCVTDTNTHCSASFVGGDYVVHIGKCKDIYEFNGIPFTDIFKDAQGNYHVPSSQDMSLTMSKGCNDVSVTLDTRMVAHPVHASKFQPSGRLTRIVWVAKNCFDDFTLKINNEVVLDKTPVKMIDSEKLVNYSAYIYQVSGNIRGPVSITGGGCNKPINIYTLREKIR